MTPRQIALLVLVFAALLLGIFIQKTHRPQEIAVQETAALLPAVDIAGIDAIRLKKGEGSEIELVRKNGAWQITNLWNAVSDEKRIAGFLALLSALRGEIRADDAALLEDFGIRDSEALHIFLLENGQEKVHLLAGIKSARLKEIFVRLADSNRVFVASSDLLFNLGIYNNPKDAKLDANAWADLNLFSFNPGEIERIEIKTPSSEWREIGARLPFEKDPAKVREYLDELLSLKASGIENPKAADYGFENPAWELRLVAKSGTAVSVLAGNAKAGDEKSRYFKRSDAPSVYSVSEFALRKIKTGESRFIRANPLGIPDEGPLKRLRIKTPQEILDWNPSEKPGKAMEDYLESLKGFQVLGVPQELRKKPRKDYGLEIEYEGTAPVKIACGSPEGEKSRESVCVNEANGISFTLSETGFESLFGNLDRLKEPSAGAPAPEATPESAPKAA